MKAASTKHAGARPLIGNPNVAFQIRRFAAFKLGKVRRQRDLGGRGEEAVGNADLTSKINKRLGATAM